MPLRAISLSKPSPSSSGRMGWSYPRSRWQYLSLTPPVGERAVPPLSLARSGLWPMSGRRLEPMDRYGGAGLAARAPGLAAGPLSSEGSPDSAAAIAGEHRHCDGELDHPDHALKDDIPGGAVRHQIPRQLQRGRWHAQHPGGEGDEGQPEGPPPPPHDTEANHCDEAGQTRSENDLRRRLLNLMMDLGDRIAPSVSSSGHRPRRPWLPGFGAVTGRAAGLAPGLLALACGKRQWGCLMPPDAAGPRGVPCAVAGGTAGAV